MGERLNRILIIFVAEQLPVQKGWNYPLDDLSNILLECLIAFM